MRWAAIFLKGQPSVGSFLIKKGPIRNSKRLWDPRRAGIEVQHRISAINGRNPVLCKRWIEDTVTATLSLIPNRCFDEESRDKLNFLENLFKRGIMLVLSSIRGAVFGFRNLPQHPFAEILLEFSGHF